MSHISSPAESSLLVRDARGRYHSATANQILAAARQVVDQKMQRGADFSSPADVRTYLRAKLAGLDHEVFAVLFLDNRHRLIEYVEMFRGTLNGASVHPREVVKEALRLNAAAVILAHPHPSGNPELSQADRMITRQLREALALIEVRTLDHFIIAGNSTVSFAERGLL
ncbi:MAG: DNA repair protein RadC [Mizugakiibacter sp.]|jgi:DNA repair protein RadC|uniref:RadC family protein n=1 Tax=Rhodanobacteraceae TaxID=1775411 RepID=UPI0029668F7B|nr:DNA repair protein RadC [Rhodanobacter sp. KK11]MCE5232262.1 DNA repair protein RadC [Xanthomonadaceae bacterium]MDW2982416.1 DNA repair protein RadC [Rhodanobacter sp. KK11]